MKDEIEPKQRLPFVPFEIESRIPDASPRTTQDNDDQETSFQFRALMRKNASLQWQQRGTNFCQMLTPVLCLYIIYLLKLLIEGSASSLDLEVRDNYPRVMNANLFQYSRGLDKFEFFTAEVDGPNAEESLRFLGSMDEHGGASGMLRSYDRMLQIARLRRSTVTTFNVSREDRGMDTFSTPFVRIKPKGTVVTDMLRSLNYLNTRPIRNISSSADANVLEDGAFIFHNLSKNELRLTTSINNYRVRQYHRLNGLSFVPVPDQTERGYNSLLLATEGLINMIHFITSSFATETGRGLLFSSLLKMPIQISSAVQLTRVMNLAGASLFPLALSLLLPVFMYSVVLEKEARLIEIMKMNGLRMRYYWAVHVVFCLGLYALAVLVFMLFGVLILELQFFIETSLAINILILVGWGIAQTAMAFFLSSILQTARTATVIGYLVSIMGALVCVAINMVVYPTPDYTLPAIFYLSPQMGMARAFYVLSAACAYNQICVESWPGGVVGSELIKASVSLYVGAVVYALLALYLYQVWPQQFGVRKPPLFFVPLLKRLWRRHVHYEVLPTQEPQTPMTDGEVDFNEIWELPGEDSSVIQERNRVGTEEGIQNRNPLVCKNLRKVYPAQGGRPPKVAVSALSLAVPEGEVFGLLGPNGAGKTTLISLMTGLYEPDNGDAWIGGYSIKESMDKVQLHIGVCPQFDLLWPELTVREHLLFFSRLKGISAEMESERVYRAVEEVGLSNAIDMKSRQLSGGMKRRLSVAISLVGDPKIIFMDEPTTGLDPQTRRQLWDTLSLLKKGRSMVLTTHSMEEADVLCNRIGIVAGGVLRCVGSQLQLKNTYGHGYHLTVNVGKQNSERVEDYIRRLLPHARLVSSFASTQTYQVPLETFRVSELFERIERDKEDAGISDWGITQTSLEDVFLQIVEKAEQDNH